MPFPQSRIPFSVENPYRPVRPATSRIIFLSLEGSVTEEEYFECVSDIYSEIRSRIQFISVAEDAVHTKPKFRTAERLRELHAPLRSDKHIELTDYDDEKIRMAVRRAEDLHVNKQDLCPRYFATTVYLLLRKIMDMLPEVRE